MALLDWIGEADSTVLRGPGVTLRAPRSSDYADWSELRQASRDYLQPWEPAWPADDLTRAAYRRRLAIYDRERELGTAWPFFILDAQDRLSGGLTLSNIRRGVSETGTIGYWIARSQAGRGLATAAVRTLMGFAHHDLKLHRLEAACVPHNHASRRVLEKSGFLNEGKARAYLKINGAWADHLLFGVLLDEAGPYGRGAP